MNTTSNRTVFIFSGIASQWVTMGQELLAENPIFRTSIENSDRIFKSISGWSILEELKKNRDESLLNDTAIAHPCITAMQIGIAAILKNWGIEPDAIMGHSAGEVVSAHTAGILAPEDTFKLADIHVKLIQNITVSASMAHVSLSAPQIRDVLHDFGDSIEIAAENSPKATLLSGNPDEIRALVKHLEEKQIFCRILNSDIPFHNRSIEPYLEDYAQTVKALDIKKAHTPIYSCNHGEIGRENPYDHQYWPHHLRDPIMFRRIMEKMIADGYRTFVEIGPHPVLSTLMEETLHHSGVSDYHVIPTLKRDEAEYPCLIHALQHLIDSGYPVSMEKLDSTARAALEENRLNTASGHEESTLIRHLKKTGDPQRLEELKEQIHSAVQEVTDGKISSRGHVSGFFDMGLDSLTAVQLRNVLNSRLSLNLPVSMAFDYPDVERLAVYLNSKFVKKYMKPDRKQSADPGRHSDRSQFRDDPIAVIGMGCRFPGGANSPDAFWKMLLDGRHAVSEIPKDRFDADQFYSEDRDAQGKMFMRHGSFLEDVDIKTFDAGFFKISPREAAAMDPQQRLLLETAWETLEYAGLVPEVLNGRRIGVYIGIGGDDYKGAHLWSDDLTDIDIYSAPGSMFSSAGGRISYFFGFQGPNISVETACSGSLTATHLAIQALRSGDCEMALAGGVNCLLSPNLFVYFSKFGAMSPDGISRTFDAGANGFSRGEGCGLVLLQPLKKAEKAGHNILAVLRGSAINQDGASTSFVAPNGLAQQDVVRQALANAGLEPEDIDYIEAHGTGTALGDPIEMGALSEVFSDSHTAEHPLYVGSVKTNIGHTEPASGIASLIKNVFALKNRRIPAHLHLKNPSPHISWDSIPIRVPTEMMDWPKNNHPAASGISAFGFSGTNAHIIVQEHVSNDEPDLQTMPPQTVITVSGQSTAALSDYARKYADFLSNAFDGDLPDVSYTANCCRTHFKKRLSVTGTSAKELVKPLQQFAETSEASGALQLGSCQYANGEIVFLFTGQGSQYVGMGQKLYEHFPAYREAFDRCDDLFQPILKLRLSDLIFDDPDDPELVNQTNFTQPLIFTIQIALTALWNSWGIRPDAVVGHSIGEYAAAVSAGVFTLEDAVKLVAARGRVMHEAPGDGVMAAVFGTEEEIQPNLNGFESQVSIATINSVSNVVVSGERQAVDEVLKRCRDAGYRSKSLAVSHAFHSPLMDPAVEEFRKTAESCMYHDPTLKFISCVSGKEAESGEISQASYWCDHIRNAVRFNDSVQYLLRNDFKIFLEIGAHPILTALVKQGLEDRQGLLLPSLRRGQPDLHVIFSALGQAHCEGLPVEWNALHETWPAHRVPVPTYPFQRKEFWKSPNAAGRVLNLKAGITSTPVSETALGTGPVGETDVPGLMYQLRWQEADNEPVVLPSKKGKISRWLNKLSDDNTEFDIRNWIVFSKSSEIADRIVSALQAFNQNTILVTPGDGWRKGSSSFQINPESRSDYDKLWKNLSDIENPRVLNLWSLQDPEQCGEIADLESDFQRKLYTESLNLIQSALEHSLLQDMVWITQSAWRISSGDQVSPGQTGIWGFLNTVDLEFPDILNLRIDIPFDPDDGDLGSLTSILLKEQSDSRLGVRGDKTYCARIEKAAVPDPRPESVQISENASYLIVGGLGDLGREAAQWLIRNGARHLILTGRRELNADLESKIQSLSSDGAVIRYFSLDIADSAAMNDLFQEIRQDTPELKGIIHAAGVVSDETLLTQTWEKFEYVFAPKVWGGWNLHQQSLKHALDFFVLYSSASSLLGNANNANYAAANACLDGLAEMRRGMDLPAVSISWGPWANIGMAANLEITPEVFARLGYHALEPKTAIAGLEHILNMNYNAALVMDVDWSRYAAVLGSRIQKQYFGSVAVSGKEQTKDVSSDKPSILTELSGMSGKEQTERVQQFLQEIAHRIIGFGEPEDIDIGTPLLDQGFDSLMAVEFRTTVNDEFDYNFNQAVFFRHPTIMELTELILTTVLK